MFKAIEKSKEISLPLAIYFFTTMIHTTLITKATLLAGIVILILVNLKKRYFTLNINIISWSQTSFLFLLHLWLILSIFWTVIPTQTLIYVVNDLEILTITFLIAMHAQDKNIGLTLKITSIVLITCIILYNVLFYGDSISPYGLKSFYIHKNSLGNAMAITSLILIYTFKNKMIEVIYIVFSIALLFLSQSKTSQLLFLSITFMTLIIFILKKMYVDSSSYTQGFINLISKIVPYIFYTLILLLIIFHENISSYLVSNLPFELFTGRGLLWATVLSRSSEDLLIGLGPGVFWANGGAGDISEIAQTQLYIYEWIKVLKAADGAYIDIIGAAGFIGLALLLCSFVQIYKTLTNNIENNLTPLAFSMVTFLVLHNITETDALRFLNPSWFLFMFFVFHYAFMGKERIYNS